MINHSSPLVLVCGTYAFLSPKSFLAWIIAPVLLFKIVTSFTDPSNPSKGYKEKTRGPLRISTSKMLKNCVGYLPFCTFESLYQKDSLLRSIGFALRSL